MYSHTAGTLFYTPIEYHVHQTPHWEFPCSGNDTTHCRSHTLPFHHRFLLACEIIMLYTGHTYILVNHNALHRTYILVNHNALHRTYILVNHNALHRTYILVNHNALHRTYILVNHNALHRTYILVNHNALHRTYIYIM